MRNKKKLIPLVSVIVPTKNSADTISKCLKSIRSQTYKNIEIIVIDNFSSDFTIQKVKPYAHRIFTKGPERNIQRNFGILKSKGKYILWLDSDMALSKNVIANCVEILSNNRQIKALVIPEVSTGKGFWAKCKALEKKCYLGDEKIEAVRFADKKVISEIGGFSKNFISGEDWDITNRIKNKGYGIARASRFIYHNEGDLSLIKDLSKKYYYATKSLPYLKRHVKKPTDVLYFVFRPAFFRNWALLIRNPVLTAGMLFMKLLEFSAGTLGIIVAKYKTS